MEGRYEFENGEWTWGDSPCLTVHGQYYKMYGSFGFVNYHLMTSEELILLKKIRRV